MRTIVITGASDGIGAAAAEKLAGPDTRLVLVGRTPAKLEAVASRLAEKGPVEHHAADFERLDDVRALAAALLEGCDRIDVLANNAGGTFAGPVLTSDGFERTFQVNHLAPVLLTNLLKDRLLASEASVVNTSSVAARLYGKVQLTNLDSARHFSANRAYGNAKLANILFTKGLHQRFAERGLSAVAFHPGVVATNFAHATSSYLTVLYRTPLSRFLTPVDLGGGNLAHFIAGTPGKDWQSGEFYSSQRRIVKTNPQASDPEMIARHWEISAEMLGIDW